MTESITPQQLAEACISELYRRDVAAQEMGIEVKESQPHRAVLTMKVRRDMLNGHSICHGGFIFALADTAFAYACNSANQSTVGQGAAIEYLAPGRLDDTLVATAFLARAEAAPASMMWR